jgi:hypothetical protein
LHKNTAFCLNEVLPQQLCQMLARNQELIEKQTKPQIKNEIRALKSSDQRFAEYPVMRRKIAKNQTEKSRLVSQVFKAEDTLIETRKQEHESLAN